MDEINCVIAHEVNAAFGKLRSDADRRFVVVEKAIDYGLPIRVGEDGLAENVGGMERGRRGQADLDRIEMLQDPAVLGDIVSLIAEAEITIRHFAIEQIAPMTFIDDHEIILVNRRRIFGALGIENAPDQALNRADVHPRIVIGRDVGQAF